MTPVGLDQRDGQPMRPPAGGTAGVGPRRHRAADTAVVRKGAGQRVEAGNMTTARLRCPTASSRAFTGALALQESNLRAVGIAAQIVGSRGDERFTLRW